MLAIIGKLLLPPIIRHGEEPLNALGLDVRIEDHFTIQMTGSTARGLDQARFAPQKALFIRIQNRHERHFRKVKAFTQKIDPNQHIEFPFPQ